MMINNLWQNKKKPFFTLLKSFSVIKICKFAHSLRGKLIYAVNRDEPNATQVVTTHMSKTTLRTTSSSVKIRIWNMLSIQRSAVQQFGNHDWQIWQFFNKNIATHHHLNSTQQLTVQVITSAVFTISFFLFICCLLIYSGQIV